MNKLKLFFASALAVAVMMPIFALVPAVANAADPTNNLNINSALCNGVNNSNTPDASCTVSEAEGANKVQDMVNKVVSIFSWVVGIVSVIMIIFGGFKYITSGGDSNGVTSAKNTIMFAIVGLVIVALAQVIVKFVIGTVDKGINGTPATNG